MGLFKRSETVLWMDAPSYSRKFLPDIQDIQSVDLHTIPDKGLRLFLSDIFRTKTLFRGRTAIPGWATACVLKSSQRSHYDLLIEQGRLQRLLPTPLFCIAGTSTRCHGQRDRPWSALEGNLHLSVSFHPQRVISDFTPGLLALAAVSVIETLDNLPGFKDKAGIKWVNDILVADSKVGGFLVYTQSTGHIVHTVVMGLGLNIETHPQIFPDSFVPEASCLQDFNLSVTRIEILETLLHKLHMNFRLLKKGGASRLIDTYRQRSLVLGRQVKVLSDPINRKETSDVIAMGVVDQISDQLELIIRDHDDPVTQGRLVFLD